jgi:hypothetical protein
LLEFGHGKVAEQRMVGQCGAFVDGRHRFPSARGGLHGGKSPEAIVVANLIDHQSPTWRLPAWR